MVSLVHATPVCYASNIVVALLAVIAKRIGISEKFSCTITIIIGNVLRRSVIQRVHSFFDFRNTFLMKKSNLDLVFNERSQFAWITSRTFDFPFCSNDLAYLIISKRKIKGSLIYIIKDPAVFLWNALWTRSIEKRKCIEEISENKCTPIATALNPIIVW